MAEIQNKGEAVKNLQRYLRRLSFEQGGPSRVAVDGIFDEVTERSLAEFQRSIGLEESGVADKKTWDALFLEFSRVTSPENESPLSLFPERPRDYSVGRGDRLLLVSVIQLLLMELSVIYDLPKDVSESGVYDDATEAAVREFQRINLLEETGRVDRETWARLVAQYNALDKKYP